MSTPYPDFCPQVNKMESAFKKKVRNTLGFKSKDRYDLKRIRVCGFKVHTGENFHVEMDHIPVYRRMDEP